MTPGLVTPAEIAIRGSFQVDGERVKRKKRVRSRKMRGDSAGVTTPAESPRIFLDLTLFFLFTLSPST
jgi:hypothetical protein